MSFDPSGLASFVNGEFFDGPEAKVSIFDRGLLYGDGIFEVMPVVSRALFRPGEYFGRLARSARAMHLTVPLDEDELLDVACELVRRSNVDDAHVRLVVTRGDGIRLRRDPANPDPPTIVGMVYPARPRSGVQSLSLLTSSIVRKAPRSVGPHIKSLNYIDSILAQEQATAAGMDDAIMVDHVGAIAECTTSNLFAVQGERVVTPTTRAALPGITRQTVLELGSELGIEMVERDVWTHELYLSDAVFQTGSGAGVIPIGAVDGHPLPSAANPIFVAISDAYRSRTRDPSFTHSVDAHVGT